MVKIKNGQKFKKKYLKILQIKEVTDGLMFTVKHSEYGGGNFFLVCHV